MPDSRPAPTYVSEVLVLGGGVIAYADACGVSMVTFDQVSPWQRRAVSTERLTTGDLVAAYIAHAVGRHTSLVTLAALAWREHLRLADEARVVDVSWTEVSLDTGVPS
ncbi:MAG: hypothetical protein IT379_40040 [Deltaproteobacteria bacterium]|nr:hypothetical protein [Deltaproteobacteria bacterium]